MKRDNTPEKEAACLACLHACFLASSSSSSSSSCLLLLLLLLLLFSSQNE